MEKKKKTRNHDYNTFYLVELIEGKYTVVSFGTQYQYTFSHNNCYAVYQFANNFPRA